MMVRLRFEFERIRKNKKLTVIFILLFLFSIASIYMGVDQYNSFQKDKENFVSFEAFIKTMFSSYNIYGAEGIRVFYDKSKLCIFYKVSAFKEISVSHFTTNDIIDMSNTIRGKSRFINEKKIIDGFGDIICLFGSLLMLYLGTTTFTGINHIKLYRRFKPLILSAFSRMLLSGLYFLFLFVMAYLLLKVMDITLSGIEFKVYLYHSGLLVLYFWVGVMIALFNALSKREEMKYFHGVIIWVLTAVVLPIVSFTYISFKANSIPPIESLNIDKFKFLIKSQKEVEKKIFEEAEKTNVELIKIAQKYVKMFSSKFFPVNNLKEEKYIHKERIVIHEDERRSLLFPPTYHQFLSNEFSSDGNYGYLAFLDYTLKLKKDFFKFFLHKKYYERGKIVESFVKGDENVYKAEPFIPGSYFNGLGVLFLYGLVILLTCLSRIRLLLKGRKKEKKNRPAWKTENSQFYFKYLENDDDRQARTRSFETDPQVSCAAKIEFSNVEPGIDIHLMLTYWCLVRTVPLEQVDKNLFRLGVDLHNRENKYPEPDRVLLKKCYLALVLAEDHDLVVIDDVLKNEDRDFDRMARELIKILVAQGKTVVYLSSVKPETEDRKILFQNTQHSNDLFQVDPTGLSFR